MVKYSIVTPVYKNKKLLKNCLMSLNNQKGFGREDFEVIVVDDGSDDDTYEYIKGVNQNYSIKYIYLERCNESCRTVARNYGTRIAKGEIIIIIDPDIICREDYMMQIDRYYSVKKDIFLVGTRLMLPEEVPFNDVASGNVFNQYYFSPQKPEWHEFRYKVFHDWSYNAAAIRYPWLLAFSCNMAAPKTWLEKVGGFDEDFKGWGQYDIELAYRLYKAGITMAFNSKLEVLHQFHGYSTDSIPSDRYPLIDIDTKKFLEKHPDALDMPEETIYGLFKGWESVDFNIFPNKPVSKKIITLNDKIQLENVKNDILELSQEDGNEIIVRDYIEDTDLDVWIQVLGPTNSIIRYFPQSKSLDLSYADHY